MFGTHSPDEAAPEAQAFLLADKKEGGRSQRAPGVILCTAWEGGIESDGCGDGRGMSTLS